jgi:hypothetical protein
MAEFIGEAQVLAVAGCSCKPPGIGNMMAFFFCRCCSGVAAYKLEETRWLRLFSGLGCFWGFEGSFCAQLIEFEVS